MRYRGQIFRLLVSGDLSSFSPRRGCERLLCLPSSSLRRRHRRRRLRRRLRRRRRRRRRPPAGRRQSTCARSAKMGVARDNEGRSASTVAATPKTSARARGQHAGAFDRFARIKAVQRCAPTSNQQKNFFEKTLRWLFPLPHFFTVKIYVQISLRLARFRRFVCVQIKRAFEHWFFVCSRLQPAFYERRRRRLRLR